MLERVCQILGDGVARTAREIAALLDDTDTDTNWLAHGKSTSLGIMLSKDDRIEQAGLRSPNNVKTWRLV